MSSRHAHPSIPAQCLTSGIRCWRTLAYGTHDGEPEERTQTMIDQPLFQALTVAQDGHVFARSNVIPSSYGAAILFVGQVTGTATPVVSPAA
ncbi:MAG TPA: hypothetical protein VNP95_06780 [Thermomicrobiales bacterium]|nr:hypothetical protein [Thermomicrobiales bacterium]